MKYQKIPNDRIGVLIGQSGKTKKELEERFKIKLVKQKKN